MCPRRSFVESSLCVLWGRGIPCNSVFGMARCPTSGICNALGVFMADQEPVDEQYLLGQTPKAIQRLLTLGEMLNPFTRRVLRDAGIRPGMKVLDVGCGPGEVSLILGDLVGPTGSVVGVDASEDVLRVARARAH